MKKPHNIAITLFLLIVAFSYGILYRRAFTLLFFLLREGGEQLELILHLSPATIYAPGVVVLSLAIFVVRVILTVREGKGSPKGKKTVASFSGRLGEFMEIQRVHLLEWQEKYSGRHDKWIYGGFLFAILAVLYRWYNQSSVVGELFGMMSMGVFWGEVIALGLWIVLTWFSNPEAAFKRAGNRLQKAGSEAGSEEVLAGDLLEASAQWSFQEESNEDLCWGILGSRFWYYNDNFGNVVVVDSEKVAKIATAITSNGHGTGFNRVEIYHYLVQFYYDKDKHQNRYDKVFDFRTTEGREEFLRLLKMRTEDRILIEGK